MSFDTPLISGPSDCDQPTMLRLDSTSEKSMS